MFEIGQVVERSFDHYADNIEAKLYNDYSYIIKGISPKDIRPIINMAEDMGFFQSQIVQTMKGGGGHFILRNPDLKGTAKITDEYDNNKKINYALWVPKEKLNSLDFMVSVYEGFVTEFGKKAVSNQIHKDYEWKGEGLQEKADWDNAGNFLKKHGDTYELTEKFLVRYASKLKEGIPLMLGQKILEPNDLIDYPVSYLEIQRQVIGMQRDEFLLLMKGVNRNILGEHRNKINEIMNAVVGNEIIKLYNRFSESFISELDYQRRGGGKETARQGGGCRF